MKLICVDNTGFEDQLTLGKDYLVLCFESWSNAQVINDKQEAVWYGLSKFVLGDCV